MQPTTGFQVESVHSIAEFSAISQQQSGDNNAKIQNGKLSCPVRWGRVRTETIQQMDAGQLGENVIGGTNWRRTLACPHRPTGTGYRSHTTPSPSPSRALGTIALRNPFPFPLPPRTRSSPAVLAASHD